MSINLTVPFVVSNGQRLRVDVESINSRAAEIIVRVTMRTATGGNPPDTEIAEAVFTVRNGRSDRVRRGTIPSGGRLTGALAIDVSAVVSPTGYTDALAAYRQNDNAFEAHVLSAGYVDASLAGS